MFGDFAIGSPYVPRAGFRSSTRINRTLGFVAVGTVADQDVRTKHAASRGEVDVRIMSITIA
jgi:hypothetical protein